MALHEFQIAEVDIENAARPPLLVDQLDDHRAFVNSCVIANDTLRSRGVLSYGAHFLEAGREGLKSRPRPAEERELADAPSKVGELQLENDILRALLEKKGAPSFAESLEVRERLPAPLMTVCRVAGVSRSAACEQRRRRSVSASARQRPGPVGAMPDGELLAEIRDVLADSPFVGEGHRKVWACLRRRGVRTSRKRVLRLTREAGLLAPNTRPRSTTSASPARPPTTTSRRRAAASSASSRRSRVIQTLKEQVLWIERFDSFEQLRRADCDFARLYNREWLLERHGYRTPIEARQHLLATP